MNLGMTYSIFIDGAVGTTGLQVADRLARHPGVVAQSLDDASRKDNAARREMMAASDMTILCLPDDAARAAAAMAAEMGVRLIDASSAHRTHADWVYGFAELITGHRAAISTANRISNPGCYPTGFLALARPLVDAGVLSVDALLTVPAISGYSGGGKAMIAKQESGDLPPHGAYGVTLGHKHVPEMVAYTGLKTAPVFMPAVGNFYAGMLVHLPLHAAQLTKAMTGQDLYEVLAAHYAGAAFVRMNQLWYADPELHQPRSEMTPRAIKDGPDGAGYYRSERQCILRLPRTRAVVFTIHTYVLNADAAPVTA